MNFLGKLSKKGPQQKKENNGLHRIRKILN